MRTYMDTHKKYSSNVTKRFNLVALQLQILSHKDDDPAAATAAAAEAAAVASD